MRIVEHADERERADLVCILPRLGKRQRDSST